MEKYKKNIIFDESKVRPTTTSSVEQSTLTTQKLFDAERSDFAIAEMSSQTDLDIEVATILTVKKKHWGWRLLVASGVGLAAWQTVDNVVTSAQNGDWLALGWAGFVTGVAALGISAIGKEFISLARLRKRQSTREKAEHLIDENNIGNAKPFCEKLAEQAKSMPMAGYEKWRSVITTVHDDKEVLELYDRMVVAEQDNMVKKIITKHASVSAVMVAVSPLALVDMLLVAWRNIRMLDEISQVYGVSLGYWSRIRLMRLVLANMAFAGMSEMLTDVGASMLSADLAAKVSGRVGQGLGIGLLTARLGYKAMSLVRPLPYIGTTAPSLSDMRKQLVERLTSGSKEKSS